MIPRPPKFVNPHCVDQWFRACQIAEPEGVRPLRNTQLRIYVDLCSRLGLLPFTTGPVLRDAAIKSYLIKRRKIVVRFLEHTKLMKGIPVRKVTKSATLTKNGFVIKVDALLQPQDLDPNWFRHKKAFWRFNLGWDPHITAHVQLDPGLKFYVQNTAIRGRTTWHCGFILDCPILPDIEDGTILDKEHYILDRIWTPISHQFRARWLDPIRFL